MQMARQRDRRIWSILPEAQLKSGAAGDDYFSYLIALCGMFDLFRVKGFLKITRILVFLGLLKAYSLGA